MAKSASQLRFFTDNNIPDSVGDFLRRRGHSVFRQRHHIPPDSTDPVVATTAMRNGRILISWDKDFNGQRFRQPRFEQLSRIALSGDGPTLVAALKENIDLIEYQWVRLKGARMIVHVRVGQIRLQA